MLIGGMNHPARPIRSEIEWMTEMGLGFIDLSLEPPAAAPWEIDAHEVRRMIEDGGLDVVGHTAYYLPIANAYESVRRGAVDALLQCIDIFATVGAKWMNIHPDRHTPFHERSFYIERNIETLVELIDYGRDRGVGIMIENLPGDFNNAAQLGELLDPLPELGLHLDIGHANLMVSYNTTAELVERYGDRLKHVHLHDNKGGHADLHLPLGAGNVDVSGSIAALRRAGYDATITLEVFSPDRQHFAYSRDVLRRVWEEALVEG
jgi:sugar phosphate isomerase/epimerase